MWTLFTVVAMVLSACFLISELAEGRTGRLRSLVDALVSGLLAVVVFFVFESVADQEETGIVAVSLFCAVATATIVWRYPMSLWYSGIAINLPFWCLMNFVGEPAQPEHSMWGLAILLAGAYLGGFIGAWMRKTDGFTRIDLSRVFHRAVHGHS